MTYYVSRLAPLCLVPAMGFLTLLFLLQTRLIFPGAGTQGTPVAEFTPPAGSELIRLTTDRGERVTALFGPALTPDGRPRPDAARCPTILYFYGNGTCLGDTVRVEFARFRRYGVNVMIPEYVGYGLSGGSPGESACYRTADAAYDHLRARPDVDPRQVVVVGRSLGGAVAVDLVARRGAAGLVTLSTFTRMGDMARRQFRFVPVSLLLRHRFDSLSKIGRVTCPILVGHGNADRVVPFEMAARLAAAAKAPVTTFVVEGADHNDLEDVGGDQVDAALRAFLDRVTSAGNQGAADGH